MGSYSDPTWKTKEDVYDEVTSLAPGYVHLADPVWKKESGEWVLWMALRMPDGKGLIAMALVTKDRRDGAIFVKNMDETVGPYYHSVPLHFLDLASPPIGEGYSRDWRERVRAAKANRPGRAAYFRSDYADRMAERRQMGITF